MKAEYLGGLVERLCEIGEPDAALREVFAMARRETDPKTISAIARHFSKGSLTEIVASLANEAAAGDTFAATTLNTMRSRSPTSLAVAFRQLTKGLTKSMDECMKMEFRIVNRMLAGHDFYEGIRAALIDKGSTPVWTPARIEDIDQADIDRYFAPLPGGDLVL